MGVCVRSQNIISFHFTGITDNLCKCHKNAFHDPGPESRAFLKPADILYPLLDPETRYDYRTGYTWHDDGVSHRKDAQSAGAWPQELSHGLPLLRAAHAGTDRLSRARLFAYFAYTA